LLNRSSELFKIETGRFQLDAKPMNIADILRRIGEMSRTTFAGKQLTVSVANSTPASEGVPLALGDAMLCYSLFQNLIKNACEAAPQGGEVAITLHDGQPLRIEITNQGVVPTEIRPRFFEKFVTHGKPGGSGLGTYSAKLLAEAQGGSVLLKVCDATDTTLVTVALPRAPAR
jgi:signal transduction histidine kinase